MLGGRRGRAARGLCLGLSFVIILICIVDLLGKGTQIRNEIGALDVLYLVSCMETIWDV